MDNNKKTTSAARIAANRQNAKRSTGPRTEEGKRRASANSYRHGMFSRQLFSNPRKVHDDKQDYEQIYAGLMQHYEPIGFLEHVLVERIAVEMLRTARLLWYEQALLDCYESQSMNTVMRCESLAARRQEKLTEQLDRLQAERKSESEMDLDGESSLLPEGSQQHDGPDEAWDSSAPVATNEIELASVSGTNLETTIIGVEVASTGRLEESISGSVMPITNGENDECIEKCETNPIECSDCTPSADTCLENENDETPIQETCTRDSNISEVPETVANLANAPQLENDGTKPIAAGEPFSSRIQSLP